MLGLLLIHLLTEARLSEFHSEVELLGPGDRETAPIAFPLKLETFLMEGSYNKVGLWRLSRCWVVDYLRCTGPALLRNN